LRARSAALLTLILWAAVGAGCRYGTGGGMIGEMMGELTLTDAQQVIAGMKLGASELAVIGGVERGNRTYRVGEPIGLTAQVTKDANLAVLRVLPNGTTTLIFPSKEQAEASVSANAVVRLSGGAMEKPGIVLFEFIAAKSADSFLFDKKRAEAGNRAELGATTRALAKEILQSLKPGPGRETAAAHIAVRVEQR
jgi:Domain of unknown function (DUF4384)